jgi:hypothetical protein
MSLILYSVPDANEDANEGKYAQAEEAEAVLAEVYFIQLPVKNIYIYHQKK